jgi:hypothetical protein
MKTQVEAGGNVYLSPLYPSMFLFVEAACRNHVTLTSKIFSYATKEFVHTLYD